jgi:hypothetical protein
LAPGEQRIQLATELVQVGSELVELGFQISNLRIGELLRFDDAAGLAPDGVAERIDFAEDASGIIKERLGFIGHGVTPSRAETWVVYVSRAGNSD